jgi:hypothetical protein
MKCIFTHSVIKRIDPNAVICFSKGLIDPEVNRRLSVNWDPISSVDNTYEEPPQKTYAVKENRPDDTRHGSDGNRAWAPELACTLMFIPL